MSENEESICCDILSKRKIVMTFNISDLLAQRNKWLAEIDARRLLLLVAVAEATSSSSSSPPYSHQPYVSRHDGVIWSWVTWSSGHGSTDQEIIWESMSD